VKKQAVIHVVRIGENIISRLKMYVHLAGM